MANGLPHKISVPLSTHLHTIPIQHSLQMVKHCSFVRMRMPEIFSSAPVMQTAPGQHHCHCLAKSIRGTKKNRLHYRKTETRFIFQATARADLVGLTFTWPPKTNVVTGVM